MAQKRTNRRVKAEPKTESTGILILGMHRSGTSATAGALPILGVPLGERMVPAAADNPLGYWEHAQIVTVHERLLAGLRRTWEDVRPLPENWLDCEPAKRAETELAELIDHEFSGLPLWGAKDPRMIRFLPLWCRLLDRLGVRAKFLFVVRDPEEVAASLAVRDGIAAGHARLLWLQHLVEAEVATRQRPRAMIDYASLLADPEKTLQTAGAALAITWPRSPSVCRDALIAFLDAGQRHHQRRGTDNPKGMLAFEARATYTACMNKARGESAWMQIAEQKPVVDSAVAEADWISGLADALSRCREGSATLDARLSATDQALQEVTELSLLRLEQVSALEARLQQTDQALAEATALALDRLEYLQAQATRLDAAHAALEQSKQLALEQQKRVAQLSVRINEAETEALMQREYRETSERHLAELLASRSWRFTRPLRAIAGALSRLFGRGRAR